MVTSKLACQWQENERLGERDPHGDPESSTSGQLKAHPSAYPPASKPKPRVLPANRPHGRLNTHLPLGVDSRDWGYHPAPHCTNRGRQHSRGHYLPPRQRCRAPWASNRTFAIIPSIAVAYAIRSPDQQLRLSTSFTPSHQQRPIFWVSSCSTQPSRDHNHSLSHQASRPFCEAHSYISPAVVQTCWKSARD
jgi:hypothetical protein